MSLCSCAQVSRTAAALCGGARQLSPALHRAVPQGLQTRTPVASINLLVHARGLATSSGDGSDGSGGTDSTNGGDSGGNGSGERRKGGSRRRSPRNKDEKKSAGEKQDSATPGAPGVPGAAAPAATPGGVEDARPEETEVMMDAAAGGPRSLMGPPKFPDSVPDVLVIPVSRNPLFPNFIRVAEISDQRLIAKIKLRVRAGHPYAGAFLRKDENA